MVRGLGEGSALVVRGDGYRLQRPFYRVFSLGYQYISLVKGRVEIFAVCAKIRPDLDNGMSIE